MDSSSSAPNAAILEAKFHLRSGFENEFAAWQAEVLTRAAGFTGFLNSEITPCGDASSWAVMLRFATTGHLDTWRESETWRHLLAGAQSLIAEKSSIEIEVKETEPDGGVVEVIVTKVKAGREAAYRQWETKIQQAQSKFPGYCGSYVQPPLAGELGWTTLMRFDTAEHLDKWLKSPERVENAVAKHPSIVRVNPRRDLSKPCVCVGMTGLPVDERFENHKNGYKSPWVVRKYGVRLMPEASQASNENGTDRQAVTQTGTRRPANGARWEAATWTALVAW